MSRKHWLDIPNSRYRIEADKYQFIVVERYTGTDNDGNPKEQERDESYHSTLEHVLLHIRTNLVKDCHTVEEILKALRASICIDKEQLWAVLAERYAA